METPFHVAGKPFFILGGQVHNSSGYGPESMQAAWKALEALGANTAEVPVYWEQVEPREGEFTFTHLDGIIAGARQRGLRLVLLWFATWKNGSMQYAPGWVKANPARFWPVSTPAGNPVWVLSSHCHATQEADRKAYCALLAHLKEMDQDQQTVIGVQIENEPGILGSVRDYGSGAEAEFQAAVPAEALAAVRRLDDGPEHAAWQKAGGREDGRWEAVFGDQAAEYFSTWSIARYIDRLAEAGKGVYPLPVYANVWLGENGWRLPGGDYPSGGPVSSVLDLWKAATPHIDLIAPDIYLEPSSLYDEICSQYRRPDNPLFVPESGGSLSNAMNMFSAIARYHAVGYAVFGIESLLDPAGNVRPEARALVDSFRCAAAALPLIERLHGSGSMHAVIQREFANEQYFDFGDYLGIAQFAPRGGRLPITDFRHRHVEGEQRGRGLIFTPTPREFYLAGAGYSLLLKKKLSDRQEFSRANDHFDRPLMHYLRVEEGHFSPGGEWVVDRLRNGDEITGGLWAAEDIGVLHAVLAD